MKPDRIQLMLAACLEGELSPEEKREVDGHLEKCGACREELDFLKRYRKRMGSLQTVKAPADLLIRIHERLDRPSAVRRIFQAIFLPLKIKLPLEAAGLLAATALVIFIIYPGGRMDETLRITGSVEEMNAPAAGSPDREATRIAMRERQTPPGAAMPVKKAAVARETGPVVLELALLMEPQTPAHANGEKLSKEEDAAPLEMRKPDDSAGRDELETATKESAKAVDEKKIERSLQGSTYRDTLNTIKRYARESGGKILSERRDTSGGGTVYILVEIPVKNLTALTAKLKKEGNLRTGPAPERRSVSKKEKIRVEIKLVPAD